MEDLLVPPHQLYSCRAMQSRSPQLQNPSFLGGGTTAFPLQPQEDWETGSPELMRMQAM